MNIFTKDERRVIVFVLAVLFIGAAMLYAKRVYPARLTLLTFDEDAVSNFKKVNINTADLQQLTELNGIGPMLGTRIISYRNEHGPFRRPDEIKNVRGIGEKTFEKMKEHITVD